MMNIVWKMIRRKMEYFLQTRGVIAKNQHEFFIGFLGMDWFVGEKRMFRTPGHTSAEA